MRCYIAAGFDPARFWEITPRLFILEMEGAALRDEKRRSEIWFTAMLPQLEKPPSHQEFVTGERDKGADLRQCLAAWDKMDRALMAGH